MTGDVDGSISDACGRFLRGETSVIDFTYAFRAAVAEITRMRALQGVEIELFEALEGWETSGWQDRPAAVERLRAIAASATA
jgi:hypothetical protein